MDKINKDILIEQLYDYICCSWCEWNGTGKAGNCPNCRLRQDLEVILNGKYETLFQED